jgi:hypothetical protein
MYLKGSRSQALLITVDETAICSRVLERGTSSAYTNLNEGKENMLIRSS